MDLLCIRWVDPVGEFPRMGMYGYFTHGTDPPSHPYSSRLLFLPNYLRRLPSPTQFRRRLLGPVVLATLQGTVQPSDYWQRFAFHFACAYRFAATAQPADATSSPEVTRCSSVPCRPHTPWCGG